MSKEDSPEEIKWLFSEEDVYRKTQKKSKVGTFEK